MSREEVWYRCHMTILMQDVVTAQSHETRLDRGEVPAHRATHWVDWVVGVLLWGSVLMAASGLGLLLEAIVDTVRHGHPR
jgi:hypothetical protein